MESNCATVLGALPTFVDKFARREAERNPGRAPIGLSSSHLKTARRSARNSHQRYSPRRTM